MVFADGSLQFRIRYIYVDPELVKRNGLIVSFLSLNYFTGKDRLL